MIGVVIALLLAATVAGVLGAGRGARGRAGTAWAAVPAVLVGAAAVVALAAPAATGFGLAAVRVAAVLAAMAGGSALVTVAFALAGATGEDEAEAGPENGGTDGPAPDGPAPDGPAPDGSEGSEGSEGSPVGDESRRADGSPNDEPREEPVPASPLRGGLAIGVLERAAIAVCVLANFGGGLAVIVAAKGLARYPELRHPGAAEQFIIGTFVSVLWAVACAGVAVALGR